MLVSKTAQISRIYLFYLSRSTKHKLKRILMLSWGKTIRCCTWKSLLAASTSSSSRPMENIFSSCISNMRCKKIYARILKYHKLTRHRISNGECSKPETKEKKQTKISQHQDKRDEQKKMVENMKSLSLLFGEYGMHGTFSPVHITIPIPYIHLYDRHQHTTSSRSCCNITHRTTSTLLEQTNKKASR